MHHVVVYRGPVPTINQAGVTFDKDVPTPVDLVIFNKLNLATFETYEPGQPAAKGRPILIKALHYTRTALWAHQFVKIVRHRYPTCPIVIYGLQPGFEVIYQDIPDCTVLFNPNQAEKKKLNPYREFDLTSGDIARMGRSPLTLINAHYGAQTAIAFNVIYGFRGWEQEVPPPYPPVETPAKGEYVLVVEYGPTRERSWEPFRDEVIRELKSKGIPFKTIRTSSPESFRSDWDIVAGAWFCIFCGESDLVYAAALQGKRGAFATRPDNTGWPLRGQLQGSAFWGKDRLIEINEGHPVAMRAKAVVRNAMIAQPGYVPGPEDDEPIDENPTVFLDTKTGGIERDQSHDLGRNRARKTRKSRKNRIRQS